MSKPRGFFDDFVNLQSKIMEEQKKIYDNWMNAFNIKTDFMNFMDQDFFKNFKGLTDMDLFNEYQNFSQNAEKSMNEFLSKLPNYDTTVQKYKENMELLGKVYNAYKSLLLDANYKFATDELRDVYKVWNDEFIELVKKNFETFVPASAKDMFESFSMERILDPYVESSKKAIDIYRQFAVKEPEVLVENVKNFYEDVFSKIEKFPVVGISEDLRKKNEANMRRYFDLQLKILEFNLFLNKEARLASIKAQDNCLDKCREEKLEDFTDFYKYWSMELEKAYEELTNSPKYRELTEEILRLVKENKAQMDELFEKQLKDLPIMTENKVKNYQQKLDLISEEFELGKKDQNELSRELSNVKLNAQKDLKELKEKFEDFKNETIRANNDLKGYLETKDEAATKKEFDAYKEEANKKSQEDIKKLQDEIAALKKELEEVKKIKRK